MSDADGSIGSGGQARAADRDGAVAPPASGPGRRAIVFAKLPVAGRVKTRLAAGTGDAAALAAHRALLAATLGVVEALPGARRELRYDGCGLDVDAVPPPERWADAGAPGWAVPDSPASPVAGVGTSLDDVVAGDPAALPARLAARGWRVRPQAGADLGARMDEALRASLAEGDRPVLVGSDCPVLVPADLDAAFAALDGADAVFAPAEDGGYALVGVSRPLPRAFEGIAWSTSRVLADTLARLREGGARVALLRTVWDVDDEAGLRRWRAERRDA